MPRLTHPSGLPQEVLSAIEIFGNQARVEILHRLVTEGPLTATQLGDRVGAARMSTHSHLRVLEDAGVISADVEPSKRPGRRVTWSINAARVQEVGSTLLAYVTAPGAVDGSLPRP